MGLSLTSLRAPFSDPVVTCLTLGASFSMALIFTFMQTKSRGASETLLLAFYRFIAKSVSTIRNPRALLWYTAWLVLTSFIAMTYTNVLRSVRVVPGVRHDGLTFEDMADKHFTFESRDWKWMKGSAVNVKNERNIAWVKKDQLMTERTTEGGKGWTYWHDWYRFIEYYSETEKRALVEPETVIDAYKLTTKTIVWDSIVGTEHFFNGPVWWSFRFVERGSLLAKSVDRFKEMGLISYFLRLADAKSREAFAAQVKRELLKSGMAAEDEVDGKVQSLTMRDPLTSESCLLIIYGLLVAAVAFVGEVVGKRLRHAAKALRHRLTPFVGILQQKSSSLGAKISKI